MYQPEPDKGYQGYPQPGGYYPQPGAVYPPPPPYGTPQPQPTVILAPATTVILNASFTDTPASCTCPVCRQTIVTRVEYNTGLLTWLIFGLLLLFGCWLGCCLIPFCVDSCKDVDHFCPNCNHHLSKYKRL